LLMIDLLQAVAPFTERTRLADVLPGLVATCKVNGINTPMRACMFVAQCAHESIGFTASIERWGPTPAQQRYEGRVDLGNIQPGDGYRYRGRGWIQLTGRANYRKASAALGFDYETTPDMVSRPVHASAVSGWFWKANNINRHADAGDYRAVTKAINGGYTGYDDRLARFRAGAAVMNLDLSGVTL